MNIQDETEVLTAVVSIVVFWVMFCIDGSHGLNSDDHN